MTGQVRQEEPDEMAFEIASCISETDDDMEILNKLSSPSLFKKDSMFSMASKKSHVTNFTL